MEDELFTVERLVDLHSLKEVIETLSTVCCLKADHLRSNWQDSNLADIWEIASSYLDKVSQSKEIREI